jgi:hypothetical protein
MPQSEHRDEEPSKPRDKLPPAGPHAQPELTDNEKTPGTGSLPDETDAEGDVGPD